MEPLTMAPSPEALFYLRVVESAVLLFLLLVSPLLKGPSPPQYTTHATSEITTVVRAVKTPRRQLVVFLLSLAALSAFLDGSVTVGLAVFKHIFETKLPAWKGIEFYSVALLVAFAGFAIIGAFKEARGVPIWQSKLLKLFVLVALVFDVVIAIVIPLVVPIWNIRPDPNPHIPETPTPVPPVGIAPAVHFGLTVFRALVLIVLFPTLFFPRTVYEPVEQNGSGTQNGETSLLIPAAAAASAETSAGLAAPKAKYGTFNAAPSTAPPSRAHTPAPSIGGPSSSANDRTSRTELTWSEIGARLKRLAPYLWPHKSFGLQLLAAICLIIVAAGRVINVAIPFKLSEVVEALTHKGARHTVWTPLLWYVGLRFLAGTGGLGALRDLLWAPVMQFSDRSMSQLSFDHLLNLSLAWHTRRKTGEVLRILDRGAAINHIFELLIFNVIPTIADIVIAIWIFFYYFGPVLSIVIAAIMVVYVGLSIILTSWRTRLRRQMVDADVATRGIHTDSLLNYETVKYFGGEEHEGERYRDAISRYQKFEIRVMGSLSLMNLTQNLLLSAGLLVGSLLVVLDTTHAREETVKRYIVFITYLAQLYGPLNSLAYIYRSINQNLIDTERLLDLLDEPSEVQDKPDAKELVVTDGVIEFDNVTFSYDGRTTALNGISFKVPRGGAIALVGESGSGKSTILRLLYRFYDLAPGDGAIRIDGQDIRDVTQASLRKAIGVVPQDSVLFNNTIAYNIGYGKFGSSTEEIENAARAAQMHERICSFPDGYETVVGERGVRLSGGEKQRVAIARTILKAPRIILLDEATSALDTNTERDIQKALQNLTDGRSSVSIAHRLSTVSNADLILVLHQGEIVESGSHRELVDRDGRFAAMWADQISSADETRTLPDTTKHDNESVPGYAVDAPSHSNQEAHILPVHPVDTPDNLSAIQTDAGPVALGLGPQIVPPEQLVAAGVTSAHPEPIKPEQQEPSDQLAQQVRPDVSFAAVASGEAPAPKVDEAPVVETSKPVDPSTAPAAFPTTEKSIPPPAPISFPKSDDDASLSGSTRPPLRGDQSGSGTPGISFAAGTEGERSDIERMKHAAQRFRKISQGAAAKSGQSFAHLARRISRGPNRQASMSVNPDAGTETPKTEEVRASEDIPRPSGDVPRPSGDAADTPAAESPASIAFPPSDSPAAASPAPEGDGHASTPEVPSTPGTPGTPGISFAPGTEGERHEGDRIKHAAQRFRKISQGAAVKSTAGFANLARRMSLNPNRQPSSGSVPSIASPPGSPGMLQREASGSIRQSMDAGEVSSVADSDKKRKKDKKDKRKSSAAD
ncbi:ATP-binding cassette sub-family B member 6, mitochondrial [Mus musculus] [Rhizoctonia solani]|uniref:ATP-binding cassette sub-family B member 6, mitochondrial [Mus musculus] n=1 Tax=Rhizoctonia solani TaxID=456999 RepID=A0A0K6FW03_9AGAM|nr:ATP-binding cassette sub-family B member 6, mitochondrial [Mus musculus] [Rhizoctonia solani]